MKKRPIAFAAFLLGSIVILAIGCLAVASLFGYGLQWIAANQPIYPEGGCLKPPSSFSESDLIGTWESGGYNEDILVLRGDGTYNQTIHIEYTSLPDVDYESEWQHWWLEEDTGDGVPYVYLEGMNLCAAFPELDDCEHAGGEEKVFSNFCSLDHEGIQPNGVGILAVMGSPGFTQPPRGIQLVLVFSGEFAWSYELLEP